MSDIKIIDGRVYMDMGESPDTPPTSCDVCSFYDNDEIFMNHNGYSCYTSEYIYQCLIGGERSHSANMLEGDAKKMIFKTCPLKK